MSCTSLRAIACRHDGRGNDRRRIHRQRGHRPRGSADRGWEAKERPKTADYKELFADGPRIEAEWHRRTGIYPFHGLMVVKDEILKAHPWIAKSLYAAFSEAKAQWLPALRSGAANSADDKEYRDLIPLVGDDPLPYGVKANLPASMP